MTLFYNNPDFWLAFLSVFLILTGDLCRRGTLNRKNIRSFLKYLGWSGAGGVLYLLLVKYGNATSSAEAGSFSVLTPWFQAIFDLNRTFSSWVNQNAAYLRERGILFLGVSGFLALIIRLIFRSGAVFWGVLNLLILYILVRQLFGNLTALIAAFLLSISPWHLAITGWVTILTTAIMSERKLWPKTSSSIWIQ